MASRAISETIKVGLAASAIITLIIGYTLAKLQKRSADNEEARRFLETSPIIKIGSLALNARQTFLVLLLALATFSTVNYWRNDLRVPVRSYDEYDLLHYYLNAKYFDELGYFNLLPALLAADHEAGAHCKDNTKIYLAQNAADYHKEPISHALAKSTEIKSQFSKARWTQFAHDAIHLQRGKRRPIPCKSWRMLLQDHGFNGTPVWVLMARPIANAIPVEAVKLAASLDFLWLLAMLIAISWAFGGQAFAISWLFIVLSYSFRWPVVTFAFLRYDWLATMVIGICMIKKDKPVMAGGFLAYATLMRYFPILWLFGIVAKGVHSLVTNKEHSLKTPWRRVPLRYWKMAMGFVIVVALLGGVSIARDGLHSHQTSFQNIAAHVQPHNLSSRRQGLAVALAYRGETEQKLITPEKKELVAKIEPALKIIILFVMVVFGLFLSRATDWQAVGFGLLPYFWLTTSSYYYYSLRMTAIVIHASDLSKRRNLIGLLLLFGIELFCNASEHLNPGNRYFLIGGMGWLMTIYTVYVMGFLGWDWFQSQRNNSSNPNETFGTNS